MNPPNPSPATDAILGRDHFAKIEVRPPTLRPEPLLEIPRTFADRIHTITAPPAPLPPPTFTVADLIASGATFEEFTICDSGTPATRWMPTWTADPTP